jgi:glycosyltransferase involved in cell wall biosynthesis
LKVAHLSQTDAGAGAGRAAYRIHTSLLAMGVDSTMLVGEKRTSDPTVFCVAEGWQRRLRARASQYLEAKLVHTVARDPSVFISPTRFSHFQPALDPRVRAADIVSLYWVNGAFIAPEGLTALRQPVVWRLSDVWPFTGACHYPGDCDHFERQCGQCPQLRYPSEQDVSHQLWRRKAVAWQQLDLTIAAPSEWMARLARLSALFAQRHIVVIPTGIDLKSYHPIGKAEARARLGIPADRKIIVFGAMSPTDDVRKGFGELCTALQVVANSSLSDKVLAVVFGSEGPLPELPVPAMSLGRLYDDASLAAAYSCADVVMVPSLEDNLPNVALEAIACGAPVAAFDVCGMPDIVRDGWNGLLAPRLDAAALGSAVADLLTDDVRLAYLRGNARRHAEARFSMADQARAYFDLYDGLIEERRAKAHLQPQSGASQ